MLEQSHWSWKNVAYVEKTLYSFVILDNDINPTVVNYGINNFKFPQSRELRDINILFTCGASSHSNLFYLGQFMSLSICIRTFKNGEIMI